MKSEWQSGVSESDMGMMMMLMSLVRRGHGRKKKEEGDVDFWAEGWRVSVGYAYVSQRLWIIMLFLFCLRDLSTQRKKNVQ